MSTDSSAGEAGRLCGSSIAPAGWHCSRAFGHPGPCAARPAMLLETPAPTRAEIDALVAKEAERLRRAYRPLPPADERAPVPVPLRVRGRWTRVLKFPLTARRFERVFHAQGEPLVARWRLALRFALVTLRRTPSEMHPPRQTPSAGGSGQASAVPPAGSLT